MTLSIHTCEGRGPAGRVQEHGEHGTEEDICRAQQEYGMRMGYILAVECKHKGAYMRTHLSHI